MVVRASKMNLWKLKSGLGDVKTMGNESGAWIMYGVEPADRK